MYEVFFIVEGKSAIFVSGIFGLLHSHLGWLYSGPPPYDHPVYKTTLLLRPYSFKPKVKNIDSFYYFEDPINATTLLLRPGFYGPAVVVLTGFHCKAFLVVELTHASGNFFSNQPKLLETLFIGLELCYLLFPITLLKFWVGVQKAKV